MPPRLRALGGGPAPTVIHGSRLRRKGWKVAISRAVQAVSSCSLLSFASYGAGRCEGRNHDEKWYAFDRPVCHHSPPSTWRRSQKYMESNYNSKRKTSTQSRHEVHSSPYCLCRGDRGSSVFAIQRKLQLHRARGMRRASSTKRQQPLGQDFLRRELCLLPWDLGRL